MSDREVVLLEPGFVLHQRPYRNTSLLVDCLTGPYGRQTLVAQGARRPGLRQAAHLQPFRRVRLSWIRRGELGRLSGIEPDSREFAIHGDALLAGFYINELLLRLVPRGDPSDDVLSCYSSCLERLAGAPDVGRVLRLFELDFLEALGYRLDLEHDCRTGQPIDPDCDYLFEHEGGMTVAITRGNTETMSGRHLISLRERRLDDAASLAAARRLLGRILDSHLGDRPLNTRQVMRAIVDRRRAP